MSFFRSETMGYYQIVIPRESAWEVFNELGRTDAIEGVDMTPDEPLITRPFYPMIKRCDDILGKLAILEQEMHKLRIKNLTTANYKNFLNRIQEYSEEQGVSEDRWFDVIEHSLEEKFGQVSDQLRNLEQLGARQKELFEHKSVLQRSKEVLGTQYFGKGHNMALNPTGGEQSNNQAKGSFEEINPLAFSLSYLVGVVSRDDSLRFKRMMFRATKGNSWIVMSDVDYPKLDIELADREEKPTEQNVKKSSEEKNARTVFIVVYQGGLNDFLKQKLNRICDSFNASKFALPDDPTALVATIVNIDRQLDECTNLYHLTLQQTKEMLLNFATIQKQFTCSLLEAWRLLMFREKAIYANLNLLHLKHSIYTGFFWCPTSREFELHQALQSLSKRKQSVAPVQIIELVPPDDLMTPTYFKINEFTWPFQEIVNTYGIPRYKEVNPGLFAVMFFPFMFGIMFGDIGHGGLLLVMSILVVQNSDKLRQNPDFEGLILARYLFLLMGICAFYCGFIYNDFMSLPWNIFGSCFNNIEGSLETEYVKGCVYPIGFDPKWYIATNELNFFNSFKMKFSVIFGVSQMAFGILLKGSNCVYFRNTVDFVCEFVPQIIFLISTFGYMCFLILVKWSQDWTGITDRAPSIINSMINIPLKGGLTDDMPLYDQQSQESIQGNILIIAFICVPWMLFPKPLILLWQSMKPQARQSNALQPKHGVREPLLTSQQKQAATDSKLAEDLRRSLQRKQMEKEERRRQLELQSQNEEREQREEEFEIIGEVGSKPLSEAGHGLGHGRATDAIPAPAAKAHGHGHGHGEFEFGEVFVHQIIETIEFVLGSISNTASYLRLWALSLAHGQLAKVFFSKCIGAGIEEGSFLTIFIGWPVFLHCTLGVLMMMDLMECFLHALRLQWVEFQNKFYKADGVKFAPFSFVTSMAAAKQS